MSSINDFHSAVYEQKRHSVNAKLKPNSWRRKKSLHSYFSAEEKNHNLPLKYLLPSDISNSVHLNTGILFLLFIVYR